MKQPKLFIVDTRREIDEFLSQLPFFLTPELLVELIHQIFDAFLFDDELSKSFYNKEITFIPNYNLLPSIDIDKLLVTEIKAVNMAFSMLSENLKNKIMNELNAKMISNCKFIFHSFCGSDLILQKLES